MVLFQYDGKIRAYGILIGKRKTISYDEQGVSYAGFYRFDINNLRYLNKPIDKEAIKNIYSDFTGFSHTKQRIPIEYLDDILAIL